MASTKIGLLVGVVCLGTLLGGCFYTPVGSNAEVDFEGDIEYDGTETVIGGYVVLGGTPEKPRYENLTVAAYSTNQTRLESEQVGTLTNERRLNVSTSFPNSTAYITFTSPDFWQEDMVVEGYCYYQEYGEWQFYRASSEDELLEC